MPFSKNMSLKEIKHDWAEKMSGFRKMAEVLIRFVPVATSYDAEPDSSNSFSLSLNLSSTPEVKISKSVNASGKEVTEKEYKKEGQVNQVVKKFCSGNAETDHALKNCPCKSAETKQDMAEVMLDGDFLESWNLWRKTRSVKEQKGTFKKETIGEIYKKK